MGDRHWNAARAFASGEEAYLARQALMDDLNVVLNRVLVLRDDIGNRIVGAEYLGDAVNTLDASASIGAHGEGADVQLTLLYDSVAPFPIPRRRRTDERSVTIHSLMEELSNQFLGAICQHVPEVRRTSTMTPPALAPIGSSAMELVVAHAGRAQSDSASLHLGWACAATAVDFFVFTLLTISQKGATQAQIARELATPEREEFAFKWFEPVTRAAAS